MIVQDIRARQILDSRGQPTVECEIKSDGVVSIASVPSGKSKGEHEAIELRDNDQHHFLGFGVLKSVKIINTEIKKLLIGKNVSSISQIDKSLNDLDDSGNKSSIGSNTTLAVSVALTKALANNHNIPVWKYISKLLGTKPSIPRPMFNMINGGMHADNKIDIQEFLIIPTGKISIAQSIELASNIWWTIRNTLKRQNKFTGIADEGGFQPDYDHTRQVLNFLNSSITKAGYRLGDEVVIGLDLAASTFYRKGLYHLTNERKTLTSDGMIGYIGALIKEFNIVSVEDGLAENDDKGWAKLTNLYNNKVLLVGDDLFVTNAEYLMRGNTLNIANSIIIKPNQIGTVSQTLETILTANKLGYVPIMSHRSGDTNDSFIADLAVGSGCPLIKAGAPQRGERVAKYNRLIQISEEAGIFCSPEGTWRR